MKKFVEGIIRRPGVHCSTSAIRDIFEFHGFKFSEDMCFGLGSGLGFVYWKSKQMPFPFIGGRTKNLEIELCKNLGIDVEIHKTTSKKRAYDSLRELISSNIPVMIHIDMPYLPYLNVPKDAHFGEHTIVVAGLDQEKGEAYVADTDFEGLQRVSLGDLEKARNSKFGPFPAQNKWFTFEFPPELSPLDEATKKAISKTVENLLNPPIRNLGVKGIRKFADEIIKWERLEPQELREYSEFVYVFIEEAGTGGGCFRRIYSRFLKEAGETIENDRLVEVGEEYTTITNKWTEIARRVRKLGSEGKGKVSEKLEMIHEDIIEVAGLEENSLFKLKESLT